MKQWLPSLLSELHREVLKPRGFRKDGKTFMRDCGTYRERYNFQGSSWNGTGVKWRFYVNVGLEFSGLEPERYWSHFANTHWASRLELIVPNAPAQWDYSAETDREEVKRRLAELLENASQRLASDAGRLHEEYVARRKSRQPQGASS